MALAPAVSFLSSLLFSLFIQDKLQEYHMYSKYNLFLYTIAFFTISCVLFYLIVPNETSSTIMLYTALVLQGAGLANMLNTSTSLVSEMIGQDD
jgi:MFS family permease